MNISRGTGKNKNMNEASNEFGADYTLIPI